MNARASFGAQLKCHLLSGALRYPLCPSHMLGTSFLAGPTIVKYKLNIYPMTRNCVIICLISLSCWPAGSKWADLHLDYHCCVSHTYGSGFMRICGKNMCLKACMIKGVDMGDWRAEDCDCLEQAVWPAGLWKASNTRPENSHLILPATQSCWRFWSREWNEEINWWHFQVTHFWKDWWN